MESSLELYTMYVEYVFIKHTIKVRNTCATEHLSGDRGMLFEHFQIHFQTQ